MTGSGGRRPALVLTDDTIARRLRIARLFAGDISIREAAARCGYSSANWSNWENGMAPRDLGEVYRQIGKVLDVDPHWLIFGPGDETAESGIVVADDPSDGERGYRVIPSAARTASGNQPNGRAGIGDPSSCQPNDARRPRRLIPTQRAMPPQCLAAA
jgi:transcriptional regulator with XRE-family HTH domain